VQESHHHIGHLHAGVVDVVLHVHLLPGGAQQAHERVAENGVAQVADVRGLVGIDAGVLDQRMNDAAGAPAFRRGDVAHAGGAVEPRIDVTRAGNLKAGEAFERQSSAATISCAMILGALRSLRASSNAMGVASSPNFSSGGISSGMVSS
jgi:hypothetical protein